MAPSQPPADAYDALQVWLYEQALTDCDIPTFQAALAERLAALGIALHRMHLGLPILHPLHAIGSYN